MKLQVPFIQLPLLFDAQRLGAEIGALEESLWMPHPQGFAGNSMLPLVAVDGDPRNESFAGPMRPTPALERSPYLSQVFASLQAPVGRSRLMRLSGHAEVTRHVDQGYYWAERVRVHVPILTQPSVVFECGEASIHMAAGECWIFDTWRQHRVLNDATASRIHLVIDTVGSDAFWGLAAAGRPHGAAGAAHWRPVEVPPQPGAPEFACESMNVPAVMTPWEMKAHFALLFAEALPHPGLPRIGESTSKLLRRWMGLWAQYGDAPAGRAAFQAALHGYLESVREPSRGVMLKNHVQWFGAMSMMVAKYAVAADADTAAERDA